MVKARGYTLVALLVGITAMTILIAAVLPLASAQAQRDREAELIFRGRQYAEGIRIFRRRFGRYPTSLKEMIDVKPRAVRKLWKDPMTQSGEWGLIALGGLAPINNPPGGGGVKATPSPTPTPSPFDRKGKDGGLGGNPPGTLGPITGVHSLSKKKGFRTWEGRQNYDEWQFTEASLNSLGDNQPGPGIGGGSGPTRTKTPGSR